MEFVLVLFGVAIAIFLIPLFISLAVLAFQNISDYLHGHERSRRMRKCEKKSCSSPKERRLKIMIIFEIIGYLIGFIFYASAYMLKTVCRFWKTSAFLLVAFAIFFCFDTKQPFLVKSLPQLFSESTRLSLKISDLTKLTWLLDTELNKARSAKDGLESSYNSNLETYGSSTDSIERECLRGVLQQQRRHLIELIEQEKAIRNALTETNYMIAYAEDNLNMMYNEDDKKEVIEKIEQLKLRTQEIVR